MWLFDMFKKKEVSKVITKTNIVDEDIGRELTENEKRINKNIANFWISS